MIDGETRDTVLIRGFIQLLLCEENFDKTYEQVHNINKCLMYPYNKSYYTQPFPETTTCEHHTEIYINMF